MAIRTYKVTLDSKNTIAPEPVYLRQGDKTGAVVIDATLMDNGSQVSLNGLTPSFMANTADGKALIADTSGFNIVDAPGGEFTYQVPSQLGSVDGKIKIAYFSFSDSSGAQSTFNVVFVVERAADMTRESAKDWVSNLNDIISQYNHWVNNAHSSWQDFVNANKEIIESIDPGGTLLAEIIAARNGKSDLKTRLDDEHAQVTMQLQQKADQAFVDSQFATIVSGAPKGTYKDLTSLQTAYPSGAEGVFLVRADGHWYYWNSTTGIWTDGGAYQATSIDTDLTNVINLNGVKNLYYPSYPVGNLNPQTFSGITIENIYDGTLNLTGTVTSEVYFNIGNVTLTSGKYTLTGMPTNGITVPEGKSCNLQVMDGGAVFKQINTITPTVEFVVPAEKTYSLRLRINVGVIFSSALFKPMIRMFGDGTFIKKTKTNLELEQSITKTNALINRDNALYGKEVVWFGTSIPAGGYLGKDVTRNYPTYIANKFGAIVHNEAIGSSPAHCRDLQFVSTKNPHGFNLSAFNAVSRCLTNTQAQMQWAIDHWADDIWGSKPSTLTDTDKTNILNGSYEVILDKYLTENTFPDLFVFDHGYNDYIYPDNLFDQNYVGHEFEPFTFNGAMNFLIRRIYNYNPNAKIVIIGNYDYDTRNGLTVQAQEKVAKRWGIPIFNTWQHTSISSEQVYTSYTWTLNGNSYEQTAVASHLETMRNILLPDGIHPHSRPDDLMINRMANAIGNFLNRDITFE